MDRVPEIDSESTQGRTLEDLKGKIAFENVDFTYPARENHRVLNSVSFTADPGQTVALCGQSGSGKSTCIQLLQRFYDADNGAITIDDVSIKVSLTNGVTIVAKLKVFKIF